MIGYIWRIKPDSVFVGEWQWQVGQSSGGESSREQAEESLRLTGATQIRDVTSEGGAKEFGNQETNQ